MPLTAGARLGPYEVLGALGAGGMGEVYKAKDTRLERTVAVKVLPQRLSSSPESRQRFEREAKTISQLAHPHICALYDVGNQDGVEYLVMEYLEGETLADRLAKGALPLEQTLRFGAEIAQALEAAHRQGIVHRDLKPGNVMLTKAGVKLMDFGLARAMAPSALPGALSALPTQEKPLTAEGAILGTLQYMAPEQLEGKETDARTDIFALGATLYEMATGRKAFSGASQASLISSIMQSDPPAASVVSPMSPPSLDRVVRTCLAKDPEERWQSAGDVAKELRWVAEADQAVPTPVAAARAKNREPIAWTIAALALLLGAVATLLARRPQAATEVTRFTIEPPPGQLVVRMLKLSPDARRILFLLEDEAGKFSLAVRSLDSLAMRRLEGTEEARGMFWSPDGREVAFFSEGKLKRMSAEGGPARTVCESRAGFNGSWSSTGTILFSPGFGAPIVAVQASGGTPVPVTTLDTARGEIWHGHPAFLPDGRHFVFVATNMDPEKTEVCLASLDSKQVRPLFHADSAAIFAEPGYLLFGRDGAGFAWRFDPARLELIGEPALAFEHVTCLREDNFLALSAVGNRAVYRSWVDRRRLVWVDRTGREVGTLGDVGGYTDVRISPDGRKAAVCLRDPSHGESRDVWVLDISRGTSTRITSEASDELDPAWFPDGQRLVYVSDRFGFYDLFERPASGGVEKILVRTQQDKLLPVVSPDGKQLLVTAGAGGEFRRFLIPLSRPAETVPLSGATRFSEQHAEFSPDGRWTAFDSNESGQREIYVQPLPEGPKRQVSIGGGQWPVWNRNGSELFYASRDGMLMSVPVRVSGSRSEIGEPRILFPLRLGTSAELPFYRHAYDVAPDGQRFLVIRRAPDAEPDAVVVVTNWTAALKEKP